MTDRELMQQALDALESMSGDEFLCNAAHHNKKDMHKIGDSCPVAARYKATRETLRARLAQPEPEPVTWRCNYCRDTGFGIWGDVCQRKENHTAPPQREWQSLTEDEIKHLWYEACQTNLELTSQLIVHLARNIEAKLKEKNSGSSK